MAISEQAPSAPLGSNWKLRLLILALLLLALDQWTKWLAVKHLSYGVPAPVLEPWLNWTLVHNHGAAFSFLSKAGGAQHWFFVSIAGLAALALPVWIGKLTQLERLLSLSLTLIWAGALGNLIDRMRFRYVIDFVHVHWRDVWHYPVFNIADSCITVGAVLLVYVEFRAWRNAKKQER